MIDKIWADWQAEDPARLHDISGVKLPFNRNTTVTLDDELLMEFSWPAGTTIRDVMDIKNDILCYKYV